MNNNNLLVKTGSLLALAVLLLSGCAKEPVSAPDGLTIPSEVSQPTETDTSVVPQLPDVAERPVVVPSSDAEAGEPLGGPIPLPEQIIGEEDFESVVTEENTAEEVMDDDQVAETADFTLPVLPEIIPDEITFPESIDEPVNGTGGAVVDPAAECEVLSSVEAEKCQAEAYLAAMGQAVSISQNDLDTLLEALGIPSAQVDPGEQALTEAEAELDTGSRFDSSACSSLSNSLLQTYCQETIEMRQEYEASGGTL